MFTFSACGAGDRIEPGVERSGTPGIWGKRTASPRSGRQPLTNLNDAEMANNKKLPPAPRACDINRDRTWGCGAAALHPRLYSDARYRGLRRNTRALCESLGN